MVDWTVSVMEWVWWWCVGSVGSNCWDGVQGVWLAAHSVIWKSLLVRSTALHICCATHTAASCSAESGVLYAYMSLINDTIRDASLTCARKPTWVSLIYRTEPTTKNCKTEKLKSKSRYVRSNSKSLGNHVVSPGRWKRKAAVGRICRKRRFQVWNERERVGDETLIIITNKCNC